MALAAACLVAAKLVNISIPFFLKAVVDQVSQPGLAAIPLAALIAYGAARLGSSTFNELCDALFARVGQRAGRRLAMRSTSISSTSPSPTTCSGARANSPAPSSAA